MSVVKIEFTDKEITAHGGIVLLQKMLKKMGFLEFLAHTLLPQPKSNRGYDPVQIVLQFIISIWCGANRYEHLEVARFDGVLQQLFGWKRITGHRALVRFFQKFKVESSS